MKDYKPIDNIESSNIDTPAFTRKYLDEEREETGERITLRINEEERARINKLKELLCYNADGTILKLALRVFENVIHNTLSDDVTSKISSQTRRKPVK